MGRSTSGQARRKCYAIDLPMLALWQYGIAVIVATPASTAGRTVSCRSGSGGNDYGTVLLSSVRRR